MKYTITLILLLGAFSAFTQYDAIFDPKVLNGTNGFIIEPTATSSTRLGHCVSYVGDVNNDGIDDIAFGDDYDNGTEGVLRPGKVFVMFGKTANMPAKFKLDSINGTNGFVIRGKSEEDRLGEVLAGIDDVNGDGIDDFITYDKSGAIVVYGKTGAFPAVIERSDINGTNGFLINKTGITSVANAGDHNGDGINDFIIGVPHWDGHAWIVFGIKTNFPATIDGTYLDGTKGYKATNFKTGSRIAYVVSGAGDVNDDGFDDVIVGAWTNSWTTTDIQMSYLIYGHSGAFAANLDLDNSTANVAVQISNEGNSFISRSSPAGDINNDGIDDFVSDGNVFFGSKTPYPRVLSKYSLNGSNGFNLPAFSYPAPLGDFNNDGVDDLILDRYLVLFGKKTPFADSLKLDYFDGKNGFQFKDLPWSDDPGSAGRGDFNNDGKVDIVIKNMVIFGGKNISKVTTSIDNNLYSTEQAIQVYPNPATNNIRISCTQLKSGSELIISSVDGNILYTQPLFDENSTIDISSLKSGFYILKVKNPEQGENCIKICKM